MTKSKHDQQVERDEADATVRDTARQAAEGSDIVIVDEPAPPTESFWKVLVTKFKRAIGSVP